MAGNEVRIDVVGADKGAKQAMDSTAQSGQKLAGSVQNIGQIIGGTFLSGMAQNAFNKLNGFMKESIGLAIEQNKVEAQLDATIRSTGGAAGMSAEQIKRMASEYQSLTNFGDEAVISSSNVLLTFTQISSQVFPRAQKAILDMSQALGQDLQGATIMVGKALNDPIKGLSALRRVGIQLTEQQEQQVRTMTEAGDVAGAQTVILAELERQFGGSAEAAVEADGGMQQMTNTIGDMQEEIGRKLLPVQLRWKEAQLQILETLLGLPGPVQAVVAGVAALSLGFLVLAPRILAARAALMSFGVSARVANASMGVLGVALAAITTALALTMGEGIKARVQMTGLAEDVERLNETGRVGTELWRLFGDGFSGAADNTEFFAEKLQLAADHSSDFGHKAGEAWQVLSGGANTMHDAAERFEALDEAMAEATNAGADHEALLQGLVDTYGLTDAQVAQLVELLPEYQTAVERANEATQIEAEAQSGAAAAARDHVESLEELSDQLKAQVDPAFALIKAQEGLEEAQKAVTEAEQEHTKDSPQYRAALRDEAEAALDVLHAAGALGDEFTGDLSDAQRTMLRDAGISEAAIEQLASDLRRAKSDADKLDGTRANVYTTHNVHTAYSYSGQQPAGGLSQVRAHGGIVSAGMASGGIARAQGGGPRSNMVLVGEQGPEVVDLAPGSMVHPAGATRTMLEQAGSQVAEVRLVVDSAGSRMDDLIVEIIRRTLRTNPQFRTEVGAA